MTRNQKYDASNKKRINTCDKSGVATWSDLTHDVLFLVMMRLGVVDFPAFNIVCKSWRSLALSNRNTFMASRPPMSMSISSRECQLEDFDGRMFKITLPHFAHRICVGLTCGHLILYGIHTRDFWLVNPITRHELHFPCIPFHVKAFPYIGVMAILVFSPSVSAWLFVILENDANKIWYSIAGKGAWNHIISTFPIKDLHAFKGKIYILTAGHHRSDVEHLCEMRLDPEPKLTLLKTNNFPKTVLHPEFVTYGENLGVILYISQEKYNVHQLDFEEMKWVCHEKTKEEYAFFHSNKNHSAAVKRESWWVGNDKNQEGKFIYTEHMWYFPHECLNVDIIDE